MNMSINSGMFSHSMLSWYVEERDLVSFKVYVSHHNVSDWITAIETNVNNIIKRKTCLENSFRLTVPKNLHYIYQLGFFDFLLLATCG